MSSKTAEKLKLEETARKDGSLVSLADICQAEAH